MAPFTRKSSLRESIPNSYARHHALVRVVNAICPFPMYFTHQEHPGETATMGCLTSLIIFKYHLFQILYLSRLLLYPCYCKPLAVGLLVHGPYLRHIFQSDAELNPLSSGHVEAITQAFIYQILLVFRAPEHNILKRSIKGKLKFCLHYVSALNYITYMTLPKTRSSRWRGLNKETFAKSGNSLEQLKWSAKIWPYYSPSEIGDVCSLVKNSWQLTVKLQAADRPIFRMSVFDWHHKWYFIWIPLWYSESRT